MWNKWIYFLIMCSLSACKMGQTAALSISPAKDMLLQEAVCQLKEEGFRTFAGRLSLEEQLAEAWRYQREKDTAGEARNFVVSAKAKGNNLDAVRLQAESLAKVQLAGLIETRIGQLVTNRLDTKDGSTAMNMVASSKNLVTTRLVNLYPLMEVFRDLPDGDMEIQLVMGCDRRWASEIAWAVVSANVTEAVPRHSSFSFVLTGLNNVYRTSESLCFSLKSGADCFYYMFVFDAGGVEQLFPGAYEEEELFRKDVDYSFPRNRWVAYSVDKGNHSARFEQNILLVVATLKEMPFAEKVSVDNVFAWLHRIPEEQRCEQYFSFLSE